MRIPGALGRTRACYLEFQEIASWGMHPAWAGPFGHTVTVPGALKWLHSSTPEGGDGAQDGEHL